MEILRDISMLWSMVHTLVLFLFLFESRYPRKKTATLVLATMVPLILVNLLLFVLLGFNRYGTLMLLTLSLPSCVIFYLLSKYRNGRFFFTFCMVDTVALEVVYVTNILNHYLTPNSYLFMLLVRLLAFPLIEFYVHRKLRPLYVEVQRQTKKGWGIFAVIGLLFYVTITLLMTYPENVIYRPDHIPALAVLFVLMPFIYINMISTLYKQKQLFEKAEQDSILSLQAANIAARVEEYGAANEAFRKERHDFRHKLKAIASLVAAKQYDELSRVVEEYTSDIERTRVVRYSTHPVIDAILAVYLRKAEQNGIRVKLGLAFPDHFETSETELATALANAIENAIHACLKLPEEERSLEIKVLSSPQFMIMVRNTFDGTVSFGENGLPENHEEGHGFGSRSIAAFCEKNGGECRFKAEEKLFTLFMYLK